ncbi:uncharacterized protein LOC110254870 [Exaiptasia diaphana]|uniref:C2H2-type domain-containing protein n=1 Tax=Exaiptasia diaphana TaxID=2652724 RepID=A0A913YCD5_EXADI|nr:uncharacterized protein LOC110254870 [Exaiptasia diaphana]
MSAATEIYKDMDKETAASTSRGNSFAEEKTLTKHKKTGRLFQCERCPQTFTFLGNLKRHEKIHSQEKRFECQHCSHKFYRKDKLKEHQDVCKRKDKGKRHLEDGAESTNVGESSIKRQKIEDSNTYDHRNSAIEGTLQKFQYKPRTEEKYDLSLTLKGKKSHLHRQLNKQLEAKKGIKWFVSVKAQLFKSNKDGEEIISEPHFRSLCMTSTNPYEIEGQLNEVNGKIISALMAYQKEGSGWTLSQVLQVNLNVAQYSPIKGSSYVPLPKKLRDKKAIVNIKNNDNKCFMWSILASLHSIHSKFNPERVNHYQPFVKELNFDGIEFPVTLDNISKFEKQNCIAINVLGFEDGTLFPSYITKQRFDVHVDLLLYSEGQQNHYCLIRNLNRLLSDQRKHNGTMFHCHYCLHGFVSEDLLQDHQQRCNQHGAQKIELPSEDSMPFMQFKDFHKQLRVPFVIYADFESLTTKIHSVSKEPTLSSTEKYQHHQACGFAYVILSQKPGYCKSPVVYRGEDAVETFLEMLQQEEKQISTILKDIVPMNLTAEDEAQFERATRCHICKEELGADKVRDHCHLSGWTVQRSCSPQLQP